MMSSLENLSTLEVAVIRGTTALVETETLHERARDCFWPQMDELCRAVEVEAAAVVSDTAAISTKNIKAYKLSLLFLLCFNPLHSEVPGKSVSPETKIGQE
jgi:hypothetical protein